MRTFLLRALLLLAAAPLAQAAPDIGLVSGAPRTFNLGGNSFTDSFYFDAPADATQLRFEIAGSTDVDLLVRYGAPFPGTGAGSTLSVNYLTEGAHYRAVSAETSERIVIGRYNVQPARAGRWYVVVVNFAGTSSATSVTATAAVAEPGPLPVEVVFNDSTPDNGLECSTAEWNDASARTPAGGNAGTTLGAQRRNAVLEAARILATELSSPVPIRIKACWANACDDPTVPGVDTNRCTATRATLAFAGPRDIFIRAQQMGRDNAGNPVVAALDNSPFLPRAQTIYSGTASTKLAGARSCALYGSDCDSGYDIRITINNQIGQSNILGGRSWWYGFTAQPSPAPEIDFLSTALHEITHGTGFVSYVNTGGRSGEPVGARALGFDDIYAANVVSVSTDAGGATRVTPFLSGSNAERATALASFIGIRWSGSEATQSVDNVNRGLLSPNDLVKLYAPDPIEVGSTLSHVNGTGIAAGLMLATASGAQRRLGIAAPMLNAMGWSSQPAIAPTDNLPRPTIYFDRARINHGASFGRVFGNIYYLLFYTYDAVGNPEWYLASGPVVDGVFLASTDPSGYSLLRIKFRPGQNPSTSVDAAASGQVRIDFNQAELAPACNDGLTRDRSSPLALMTFSLGNDSNQNWCMEAILAPGAATRATPDFTGAWASAESGWGFDMLSFRFDGTTVLSGLLFYPDSNGDGRWALFSTATPQTPSTLSLVQRTGYCRTCPTPAGAPSDVQAGTLVLNMVTPSLDRNAGNRANLNVTYRGPTGGTFVRDVPMALITEPLPQ
jgi:hypothetical protein